MGQIWSAQSNMNRGELDPRLIARTDLVTYYNALREATNVLTIPQGGVKKRSGTKFLGTALGNGRLEEFSFNVEQNYLLVFTDLKMQIYKDGVLQVNLNGGVNDFVVTPWTLAVLAEIYYIQSADTALIFHEDVEPTSITRTSDTDWAVATIALTNIQQFDFNDGSSPASTDEIQDITFVDAVRGDRYKISLDDIQTDELVYGADASSDEKSIQDALQALPNTANTGVTVVNTAANVFRVTFGGDSAKSYSLLAAAAIVVKNATFVLNTVRFQAGVAPKEDVWSATRGWPKTGTFHEGRLWIGGSKFRPTSIWGSRVNDFFNFDEGKGRDDELVAATLDTDQVNAITAIFSNRTLQVFTSGGEFVVPESPITPSNIAVKPQTNLGSKSVRPVSLDGLTMFIQRSGKVINQFQFINEFQSNQSRAVSVLAPHLIIDPIKMSVSRGTSSVDANYIYILNSDGSVTVYNTMLSEDVQAFTRWVTGGFARSIATVDNELYTLVERVVDSSTVYLIEKEDDTFQTDSGVSSIVGGSNTLTGLDHLEGETVDVKADGTYQGQFVVTGGQVTITRDAQQMEAGLVFRPVIKMMPLNIQLDNGPNFASRKRIRRAALELFESNGVVVNGQRIADKTIGVDQFDAPEPQTGLRRMSLGGWSLDAVLEITQDTPFPMTILAVYLEVAV